MHCRFIQTVWESLAIRLNMKFRWNGRTLCHCFETWMRDKECSSILAAHLCYNIWQERNQVIFEGKIPSWMAVFIKTLRNYCPDNNPKLKIAMKIEPTNSGFRSYNCLLQWGINIKRTEVWGWGNI